MKQYETPSIEVIHLEEMADVITASGNETDIITPQNLIRMQQW